MGRPSKPIHLVKGHRTKAEKNTRKKAEESLMTGISFKEWPRVKNNEIAHKTFGIIKKAYKEIKKDDVLFEGIINTYCLLLSEIEYFEERKVKIQQSLDELQDKKFNMEFEMYIKLQSDLLNLFNVCDKKILEKRKMMLEIGKENVMTIASAMRSIPKKPNEEIDDDPMANLFKRRGG